MKRLSIFLLSVLCTAAPAFAYDFQSGDLYYNITGENTVAVAYQVEWSETNYQGLTTASIPATVTYNGTTYSVTSIGYAAFSRCTSLTSITIPNSVTSIGEYAFRYCSSLTSITIPNSVTSIGEDTFYGCSSLTSVTIPNSVTSIGDYAFYECTSLTSITIPNSVTSIGDRAFYNCSSLTSLTIPNSVTSIGYRAFYNCSSLPVVDNVRYADTYLVEAVDKSLSTYTIKAGTKWIGDYAFKDCSFLTSITIPNSVTSIGEGAFYNCSSLPVVDHVRYADTYLVEAVDKSLSTYTIKTGTKWIGSSAFYECTSLTSITIPNSVTSIGGAAFYECTSLTSITIPNSVTNIGGAAFYECTSLTSITIPNSVTSIGDETFRYCFSLTSITIPNSVTSIGDYAFRDCSALTSVTIGNSVEYIDERAFGDCSALADIYCYATTPPQCYEDSEYGTFEGVNKHCRIHVPAGTIDAYQWAPGWRDFYHFYEISELPEGTPTDQVGVTVTGNYATFSWPVNPTASSYTLTITKDGEVFCTLIFNNMGQLVGMAFAPARDGKPSANQSDAQSTAYGFSFVVTNLDANSHYTYTFTVNGADSEVIETYSGAFDTTEETALPATQQDNQLSRKILRNGQVLILRNGETYDMMGQTL